MRSTAYLSGIPLESISDALKCPYSFSTKNGPLMGPAGGGEKPRLHLKDKFFRPRRRLKWEPGASP